MKAIPMAKDPAFLFYYQDFLVGSDHMTLEQVGGYIRCLCHQAHNGYIRKSHMERLVGSQENLKVILEKFDLLEDGKYQNRRLSSEVEKRKRFTESRIKNLKTHKEPHMGSHMENENENENKDNQSLLKGIVKGRPTLAMVKSCFEGLGHPEEAEPFYDHYEANGWKMGVSQMQSWPAACRNWLRKPYREKTKKIFRGTQDLIDNVHELKKEMGKW